MGSDPKHKRLVSIHVHCGGGGTEAPIPANTRDSAKDVTRGALHHSHCSSLMIAPGVEFSRTKPVAGCPVQQLPLRDVGWVIRSQHLLDVLRDKRICFRTIFSRQEQRCASRSTPRCGFFGSRSGGGSGSDRVSRCCCCCQCCR